MKNGEKVWYCKRVLKDGDPLEIFDKPKEFTLGFHFLTVQPMSGYNDVVEFGENIGKMWKAIGQPYDFWKSVKEGDRFYVDGCVPEIPEDGSEPEDGWGHDANAKVYSARPQNVAVAIILQKIE